MEDFDEDSSDEDVDEDDEDEGEGRLWMASVLSFPFILISAICIFHEQRFRSRKLLQNKATRHQPKMRAKHPKPSSSSSSPKHPVKGTKRPGKETKRQPKETKRPPKGTKHRLPRETRQQCRNQLRMERKLPAASSNRCVKELSTRSESRWVSWCDDTQDDESDCDGSSSIPAAVDEDSWGICLILCGKPSQRPLTSCSACFLERFLCFFCQNGTDTPASKKKKKKKKNKNKSAPSSPEKVRFSNPLILLTCAPAEYPQMQP